MFSSVVYFVEDRMERSMSRDSKPSPVDNKVQHDPFSEEPGERGTGGKAPTSDHDRRKDYNRSSSHRYGPRGTCRCWTES